MTSNRAHVLLWTDQSAAYLDAIKAAGLSDRVAVDTLPRREKRPRWSLESSNLDSLTVRPELVNCCGHGFASHASEDIYRWLTPFQTARSIHPNLANASASEVIAQALLELPQMRA